MLTSEFRTVGFAAPSRRWSNHAVYEVLTNEGDRTMEWRQF